MSRRAVAISGPTWSGSFCTKASVLRAAASLLVLAVEKISSIAFWPRGGTSTTSNVSMRGVAGGSKRRQQLGDRFARRPAALPVGADAGQAAQVVAAGPVGIQVALSRVRVPAVIHDRIGQGTQDRLRVAPADRHQGAIRVG